MHAMSKKQAKPDTAQSNCAPTATERAPVELANKGAKALAVREVRERAAVKTTNEGLEPPVTKPTYIVTAREKVALDRATARLRDNTGPPLKVKKEEKSQWIEPDHHNQAVGWTLLLEALGGADQEFLMGLLGQLVDFCWRDGKIDELTLNFMISVIKGIKPQDQVESMLAAQMAATQLMTMRFARRLSQSQSLPEQDSDERAFNKLARTFTNQIQGLKLHRSSAEQTVTVQNVSVSEGSQAMIVGNTQHAPHQTASSTPAITDARTAPMPILDAQEVQPVPSRRKSGS
jgi:hypothetical protein